MIFETERLTFRQLTESDFEDVHELLSDPSVVSLIPQKSATREESKERLSGLLHDYKTNGDKRIWGVLLKEESTFVGIAGFLRNDERQEEIAYRLKTNFWGVGYGMEIAEGLLHFGFTTCGMELITADVDTANERSAAILDRFLNRVREFYNDRDKCTDRRYALKKEDWEKRFERNEK